MTEVFSEYGDAILAAVAGILMISLAGLFFMNPNLGMGALVQRFMGYVM
jgi:hypothetical protein